MDSEENLMDMKKSKILFFYEFGKILVDLEKKFII